MSKHLKQMIGETYRKLVFLLGPSSTFLYLASINYEENVVEATFPLVVLNVVHQ